VIKTTKDLRVTHPAILMRSFFGMVISYFVTEMILSNSLIQESMPRNAADAYADIFLHGILKEPA
jgi:hypothetical protein